MTTARDDDAETCDRPYMLRVMLTLDEKKQLMEAVKASPAINGGKRMTRSHIARTALVKACKDISIRAKKAQSGP